jgi:hypothetical protein
MPVTFIVKARLESGTQIIQLRTDGTSLRLGGLVSTDPVWVITDEVLKMLRQENPGVTFVDETPSEGTSR